MSDILHGKAGNTPLGVEELEGLKHKHIKTHGELNELEQINIIQGMVWLQKKSELPPLSDEFLRELHTKLFGNVWLWAGTYRQREMSIGIDPLSISVQMRNLIDDTHFWIENNTYSPLEIAARYHHRLLQIHPFPNGNGRVARISTNLLLDTIGIEPIDWSGGYDLLDANTTPEQLENHRNSYITALRCADAHDFEPLLIFVGAQYN